jgi:hypothetical protein
MKTKLLSLLFLFAGLKGFSQSTETLKTAMKKIYQVNYLMDFDGAVSLSYPKMVENIGKDVMLEKLDKFYENEEYRLRYQVETVPFQFSSVKKVGDKSFCIITCRNPLRYFFENKISSEEAAAKTIWLKEINHTKEVTFEPDRNSFNVKRISTFVAVSDETTNWEWKFFNLDDSTQKDIFNTLFDENIKTALGLSK